MKKLVLLSLAALILTASFGTASQADRRGGSNKHHYAPRSHGSYVPRHGPGPRAYYPNYNRRSYGYSRYGHDHRTRRGVYLNLFPPVILH